LDSATDSNNLNLFDLANDLEIHAALYLSGYRISSLPAGQTIEEAKVLLS